MIDEPQNLNTEEQEIEDALDFKAAERPIDKPRAEKALQTAGQNYQKKDARINIRLSSADLNQLKRLAAREGLPYQTMISSILHKIASGLDEEHPR